MMCKSRIGFPTATAGAAYLPDNFTQRHGSMFGGGAIASIDQGHRLEVIGRADGRFHGGFERNKQLSHRAPEGVWEPTLFPDGPMKFVIASGSVSQC